MNPIVKLVSWTPNPIETVFATEKFAKTNVNVPCLTDIDKIAHIRSWYAAGGDPSSHEQELLDQGFKSTKDYVQQVEEWAIKVISMSIPVSEMIQFVFQFEDISIAWREQIVRHRTNSYWIQSGRIRNYSKIYDESGYNIPDSIKDNLDLLNKWEDHWYNTQKFYSEMKDAGILDQDAREIVGNGALHRMTMGINLRNLIHLVKHRLCWVAQDHWVEIIRQMVQELRKVDPLLGMIGHPPCFKNGKHSGCQYEGMSQERHDGEDPLPICPMWRNNTDQPVLSIGELTVLGRYDEDRVMKFNDLWFGKEE